jgi:hypothetical protein
VPPTLASSGRNAGSSRTLAKVGMKRVARRTGVRRARDAAALSRLPALKTWARDGGRFVTLPLVYTEHPERPTSEPRHVPRAAATTTHDGLHWQIGKGGGFHLAVARKLAASALPVVVLRRRAAGVDPLGDRAAAGERARALARQPAAAPRSALATKARRARCRWWPTPSSRSSARCARRARARGPVRRPLRLLLVRRTTTRSSRQGALSPPRRDRCGRRPSSASRARRTSSSATSSRSCSRRSSRS